MPEQKNLYFNANLKTDYLVTYINYDYEGDPPTEEELKNYVEELIEEGSIDPLKMVDIEIAAIFDNN